VAQALLPVRETCGAAALGCSCGTAALGGVLEKLWSAGALACGIGFPITRDSGDSGDPGDLAAPPPFLKLLLKTKA